MKWFDKGISLYKSNLVQKPEFANEVSVLATLGEDGHILVWNLSWKDFDRNTKNETSACCKPVIRTEINKLDCK